MSHVTTSRSTTMDVPVSSGSALATPRVRLFLPMIFLPMICLLGAAAFIAPVTAQTAGTSAIDTAGYPRAAEIRGNRVNIRTGPSTNHNPITQLPDRTRVVATGKNGDWVRFSLPPMAKVWISQKFVESTSVGQARVRGNKVNLRAAPNTMHAPIGQVSLGTPIFPTGRLDLIDQKNGPWVEIDAPLGASGWIIARHIQLSDRLSADQVKTFYAGSPRTPRAVDVATGDPPVVPVTRRQPGEPVPAVEPPTEVQPKMELPLPAVCHEPFLAIYEQLRVEYAKLPSTWNFDPMLADLRAMARASEDLVIADMAGQWVDLIEKNWVPYARRMQGHSQQKEIARRAQEEAERRERENEIRPAGQGTPGSDKEFLAVGWVATLGKYRKADGTHRLLKGNKLVFYLKSETLKLDDFVNKRVGISGVLQEQSPSAGANLILVTNIKVLSD